MRTDPERATWADMIREYERPATERSRLIEADLRPHMEALANLARTLTEYTETGEAMSYTREHFERVRDSENCDRCNYDMHQCPGCAAPLPHDVGVCAECQEENR